MKLALEKIATMEDLKMTETEQIPLLKKIIETHKMMSDGAVGGALALRLATPTTESIVSTINNDHEITMVRYMDILASRYKTPKTPDEEKPTDISYPG